MNELTRAETIDPTMAELRLLELIRNNKRLDISMLIYPDGEIRFLCDPDATEKELITLALIRKHNISIVELNSMVKG